MVLTGGHVIDIVIDLPGSGVTSYYHRTSGPYSRADLLISPGGYVGSALIGSGLVLCGFSILAVRSPTHDLQLSC